MKRELWWMPPISRTGKFREENVHQKTIGYNITILDCRASRRRGTAWLKSTGRAATAGVD